MSDEQVERIEKTVAKMGESVQTMERVVFHLDAENTRHSKDIDHLYTRTNQTDRDLAGFRGRVSAYGTIGGILGGAIAAFFSRMLGGHQ